MEKFPWAWKMMIVLLGRILTLNVQTLAVVNGHSVAGGCFLAFSHDKIIMNSNP